jgi:osmotically inducible protein OsmC
MFREAHAVWKDGPYSGKGTVSTPSGVLSNASYVFGLAETTASTTPGEMLAAAVASSMSTMVALKMAKLGAKPSAVNTRAVITVDDSGDRWQLTALRLEITVQTLDPAIACLEEAVTEARRDCPIVSELNLDVTCTANLAPLEISIAA